MWRLLRELFPICRSITGDGVRKTLSILGREIPLVQHCFPSGSQCYDWEVPLEWNIDGAWLRFEDGTEILNFAQHNLHVLGYSQPVDGWFTLDELRPHLFTLPEQPNVIPYVTSYYRDKWGFCLSHRDMALLKPGRYHARIESRLSPGELVLGEAFLPGRTEREILISCYICHPSMANDSLSGVVLAAELYRELSKSSQLFSYRFVFLPETIGAIAYLSRFGQRLKSALHAGLVVTCVGDSGPFHYKQTRCGTHLLDRVVANVLQHGKWPHEIRSFWPLGSDERQYCSPGFNMPVGSLMRSVYGEFPEYHTSADNLDFVSASALVESLQVYRDVLRALEGNQKCLTTVPFCEPQMGRRGLYPMVGDKAEKSALIQRYMWILNLSDGNNSLLDIAERMGEGLLAVIEAAGNLKRAGLLEEVKGSQYE
jgi:aminopeptidase-like protein